MLGSSDATTSLADAQRFDDATGSLPDDRVLTVYLDGDGIRDALQLAGAGVPDGNGALPVVPTGTLAASATLAPDHVDLEVSASMPHSGSLVSALEKFADRSEALADLPEQAWLAVTLPSVHDMLSSFASSSPELDNLDSDLRRSFGIGFSDVLTWMGDTGFFLRGTGLLDVGGAILARSIDPAETIRQVHAVENVLTTMGIDVQPAARNGLEGFTARAGVPITVLGGDRFVAAVGGLATQEALAPEKTLDDQADFRKARDELGDRYDPRLYLDFARAQRFGEAIGSAQPGGLDPAYQAQFKPYLDHLAHVVLGLTVEGERLFAKLVIGVR
jgi:hypothetical protein